jgi:hypothetical protein
VTAKSKPNQRGIFYKIQDVKPMKHLGKRKGNIWKAKLMSLKLIIKAKILEIFTEA